MIASSGGSITVVDTGFENARVNNPKKPRLLLSFFGSAFGVTGGGEVDDAAEGAPAAVVGGCPDVDAFSSWDPTLPVRLEAAWLSCEGRRVACRAIACFTVHPIQLLGDD